MSTSQLINDKTVYRLIYLSFVNKKARPTRIYCFFEHKKKRYSETDFSTFVCFSLFPFVVLFTICLAWNSYVHLSTFVYPFICMYIGVYEVLNHNQEKITLKKTKKKNVGIISSLNGHLYIYLISRIFFISFCVFISCTNSFSFFLSYFCWSANLYIYLCFMSARLIIYPSATLQIINLVS